VGFIGILTLKHSYAVHIPCIRGGTYEYTTLDGTDACMY